MGIAEHLYLNTELSAMARIKDIVIFYPPIHESVFVTLLDSNNILDCKVSREKISRSWTSRSEGSGTWQSIGITKAAWDFSIEHNPIYHSTMLERYSSSYIGIISDYVITNYPVIPEKAMYAEISNDNQCALDLRQSTFGGICATGRDRYRGLHIRRLLVSSIPSLSDREPSIAGLPIPGYQGDDYQPQRGYG